MPNRPLKIFLCHAKEDKPTVRELYRKLSAEGWIDVWLDEEKLFPGQEWDLEIEKAVEAADVVIVCLTSHSVDKEGYIQKELRFVLNLADEKPEGTIFVIPLRLDNCTVPRRLRNWQYADYFPKDERPRAYERLLTSLKMRAQKLGVLLPSPITTDRNLDAKKTPREEKNAKEEGPDSTSQSSSKNMIEKPNRRFDIKIIYWLLLGLGVATMGVAVLLQGDGLFVAGGFFTLIGAVALIIQYLKKRA